MSTPNEESLLSILKNNFDKLLLTLVFFYMTGIVIYMSHSLVDAPHVSWAREQSALVLGGLLGLITGKILGTHTGGGEVSARSIGTVVQAPQEPTVPVPPVPPVKE